MNVSLLRIIFFVLIQFYLEPSVAQHKKKNVLFIIVDDLRPEIGSFGSKHVKTPNIDKLAKGGTRFENAYCNYPVCGPSRASFLTSLRPNATRFTSNKCTVESDAPKAISLPEIFKNNGYVTTGMGKVYHHSTDKAEGWTMGHWHPTDDENSKEHPDGWRDYQNKESLKLCYENNGKATAYEIGEVGDFDYFDGKLAKRAINQLKQFKSNGQPFFMTVGFVKPHLPFNAPKKYFDMYPLDEIELPTSNFVPKDAPKQAMHNWWELRAYTDMPHKHDPMPEAKAKELIRAYYSCVSYVDAMVGEVLNALNELELDENTVVCLIGDHGWSLSEHTLWVKHSNFDKALRTTMIVRDNSLTKGKKTKALVELIDVYPTLCDLAGIETPKGIEGKSMKPTLRNNKEKHRKAVYSKMNNGWSVKTRRHRYTEWYDKKGNVIGSMLYDHREDPEETVNIANDPTKKHIVKKMKKLLEEYKQ